MKMGPAARVKKAVVAGKSGVERPPPPPNPDVGVGPGVVDNPFESEESESDSWEVDSDIEDDDGNPMRIKKVKKPGEKEVGGECY